MKYPQLVSTRAVNAISDWLVSRLEQLGVEAPQPYTRLLLSLLQSTIQLNDPIELSNLESFLASRKGGRRRYQNCDTDALKKFNAVQCLKEIVSSEQEIAAIESLVDELCEKLKDIENQTDDSDDEHKLFVATLNLAQQTQHHNTHHISTHHHHHHQSHKSHHHNHAHQTSKEIPPHSKNCNISKGLGRAGGESRKLPLIQTTAAAAASTTANKSVIGENRADNNSILDPLDLYRRAFPALSKEMENSFVTYRRNVKWLTWPPAEQHSHRRRDHTISISSSSSTISSNSAAEGDGTAAKDISVVKIRSQKESTAKDKKMYVSLENASKIPRQEFGFDINVNATGSTNALSDLGGGIKRRTKRRRSQGLSKGKTIQLSTRKSLTTGTASGAATSMENATSSSKNKRNASPTYWDTDFEGSWEMGRDLIKEFITRQNRNSRNRSTSESAVANNKKQNNEISVTNKNTEAESEKSISKNVSEDANFAVDNGESNKFVKDTTATLAMPSAVVDFSFCDCDEYDDTLASVSELTNDEPNLYANKSDSSAGVSTTNQPKRLYERDALTNAVDMKADDEQSDLARFEAKFNSTVEALWKDAGDDKMAGFQANGDDDENKMHVFGLGNVSNFSGGPTSLPCDMPFRQNLRNFWTNYYNHHFDLSKMLPASLTVLGKQHNLNAMMQQIKPHVNRIDNAAYNKSNVGVLNDAAERAGTFLNSQIDISAAAHTSDYFSMPSTLDNINKVNIQRGGIRHNSGCSENGAIGDERKTPVALFLHSSIWSENANMDGGDTDESFFYKVHNAGKQLNASDDKNTYEENVSNNGSGSGSFAFTTSYATSKWSEGINAGPTTTIAQQQQCCNKKNNSNLNMSLNSMSGCGTDCTDSSTCSTMTTAGASPGTKTSWQTVSLQDTWTGTSSIANKATEHDSKARAQKRFSTAARYEERETSTTTTNVLATPKVTLVNHSTNNSAFIAYSRIESVLQMHLPNEENATTNAVAIGKQQQLQRNYATRSKEQQQRYALDMLEDGENLLTSERTHFHPIRSYADGHTFDICSELDVIEYQRSASGYLYYEQDKYLEYARNENCVVKDDGAGGGGGGVSALGFGASANPLYANSNCEAATAKYKNKKQNNSRKLKRMYERDFVIKFRLQRTDIACQTEVIPPTKSARALIGVNHKRVFGLNMTASNQSQPLSIVFSNAAKNLKANATKQLVYSDTVEAFTRAMAHFPPPSNTASNSIWLPVGSGSDMVAGGEIPTQASHIWNIHQHAKKQQNKIVQKFSKENQPKEDVGYDKVDFYGTSGADLCQRSTTTCITDTDFDMTSLEQEWSMNEIRKKCKEAGHMTNNAINVNANNDNKTSSTCVVASDCVDASGDDDCAAVSVWDMCAACNSELKSIPANRLLRDELEVEADEIMSDLKYMQDLYIGRADDDGDGDDADDEDDGCMGDDESGADTVTSDSDWCAADLTADITDEIKINVNEAQASQQEEQEPTNSIINANMTTEAGVTNESDTLTVIQKVNRLIAELLRPENNNDGGDFHMTKLDAKATAKETEAATIVAPPAQFNSNLWHTSNMKRSIWQLNAADTDIGIKFDTNICHDKITGGCGSGGDVISDISTIHPIQILRQFNLKPCETMTADIGNICPVPNTAAVGTDIYDTTQQMSWEHENLARIWQTSPKSHSLQTKPQQEELQTNHQQTPPEQQQHGLHHTLRQAENIAMAEDIPMDAYQQSTTPEESEVAEKNMRNLRANADASVEAAAANFQKAQEFLSRQHNSQPNAAVRSLTGAQLLDSALKMKAATRKRRHSASQNLFHTHLMCGDTTTAAAIKVNAVGSFIGAASTALMHNNNNNKIANLNSCAWERDDAAFNTDATTTNNNALSFHRLLNASLHFGAAAAAAVAASNAKKCSNYATSHICGSTDIAYGCDATAAAAKNQTIITCKYHLTTIEPITAMHNNNNVDDNDVGGLFDGIATTAPLSCLIDKNSSILNHVTMMSRPLTR
ncbi:uncharacterized protein [Eurosta solidaginis]|uniref:uncharacterized protein isoform X2 n=1 Tax=Eurosta solidaginis TaxID=178769 RepID=UPI003530A5E3